MKIRSVARFTACLLAMAPCAAAAQNNGELWEISTQMDMPGMPAGMGAQTARVCQGADPAQNATRGRDREKCKVTDVKQSATRTTVTMTCPEGRAVVDQQYNAARTEFKGSMRFSGKDGEMVMNTTGRKVGACNVQEARKANEQKGAQMKADADRQVAEAGKQSSAVLIKACTEAVTALDARKFPAQLCYRKDDPAYGSLCKDKATMEVLAPKEGKASCDVQRTEFCKRVQTDAGFSAPKQSMESAASLCGLQPQKLVATLCSRAVKAEAYGFVAGNCPAEAKPLFQKHCAGRDYTSIQDKKVRSMCTSLARLDDESPRATPAAASTGSAPEARKPTATERAEKGVSEGINKLRGLFGR